MPYILGCVRRRHSVIFYFSSWEISLSKMHTMTTRVTTNNRYLCVTESKCHIKIDSSWGIPLKSSLRLILIWYLSLYLLHLSQLTLVPTLNGQVKTKVQSLYLTNECITCRDYKGLKACCLRVGRQKTLALMASEITCFTVWWFPKTSRPEWVAISIRRSWTTSLPRCAY